MYRRVDGAHSGHHPGSDVSIHPGLSSFGHPATLVTLPTVSLEGLPMSLLSQSVAETKALLARADLDSDADVSAVVDAELARRRLDLSDLSALEQAELIAERVHTLQPSTSDLADRIASANASGRSFVAKFGIDPTGSEVHIGHAVPMLVLSRFQRMGHQVVFIVGDVTAKIGDPAGRSSERPQLTDDEIAHNLSTYREQVSPFFDFSSAHFRYNGDWLREVTLPRLIEIASQLPLSMSLQREDFRTRLADGRGLSLAELLYSVVMALDSVEIACDIELGGLDQFLNMQMCRRVMTVCGQEPEIVAATALIEGTDGTGAKMSKSGGNYVPVAAAAGEVYGKLMSIPDRLTGIYLRALTELRDVEVALLEERVAAGSLHPMDLKKILAGIVTASVRGAAAASTARFEFSARFSRRQYSNLTGLPMVSVDDRTVATALIQLGFAKSKGEVRRLASERGVRIVVEDGDEQNEAILDEAATGSPLVDVIGSPSGTPYLRVGRKVARLLPAEQ